MKKRYFILLLAIGVLIFGCKKEDESPPDSPTDHVIIDSLTASFYTVKAWDTTTISCYARGENLVYAWECDHGNFNGSGTQIKYAAGQCCIGLNTITCTVSNDSAQVSRDIQIEVTTYFDWKK
jgi:hypothetical protein